jgi:cell division protein FtsW (lipid II flippase)
VRAPLQAACAPWRSLRPLRSQSSSEIVIQGPAVQLSEAARVRGIGVYGIVVWFLIYAFMDGWVMGGSTPVKWATLPVLLLGIAMLLLMMTVAFYNDIARHLN